MRLTNGVGAAFPMRAGLLATAAVAVALAAGAAQAQQPQQQSPQAGASAQQPLQRAEEGLRQAVRQMGGSGAAQPQAVQQARQALDQMRQELGRIPEDRRSGEGYRTLDREVGEARETLQGDRVDSARARSAIEEVLAAVPDARTAMGTAGAQVLVQQAAPTLQLTQPPPQVSVQQPEPVITVVVPQPEIIVRQPPAQVTVQMPEPQVGVEQRQPQVRVAEAEPQVQVRPGQPQVQVQRAQPRVEVRQGEGQPQVRYEQQGEAVVRTERQAQAGSGDGTGAPGQGASPAQSGGGAQQAAAPGAAAAGVPLARVSNLVGTNVVGSEGRDAGEVENLLIDRNGQVRAAVVEWGGFLGIGSRKAAVPIEQIRLGSEGERARMELTREQLERLPRYDAGRVAEHGREQGWGDGVRLHR